MPIDINTWPTYMKYLIETYHPIARQVIKDFNHEIQTPKAGGLTNLMQWKTIVIDNLVQYHKKQLTRWTHLLTPSQQIKWNALIQPYLNDPTSQKLYTNCYQFLNAGQPVPLHFKDYCYYYTHHTPGVDDTPQVMNKRAEPIFNQIQLLELKLIQIVQA